MADCNCKKSKNENKATEESKELDLLVFNDCTHISVYQCPFEIADAIKQIVSNTDYKYDADYIVQLLQALEHNGVITKTCNYRFK
jgi:predicted metal-binding protein